MSSKYQAAAAAYGANEDLSNSSEVFEEKFDSTGMFHWVKEQDIKANTIRPSKKHLFANHVIVCIFADPNSPVLGLRNFVLPLRASNYYYDELKPIVFIGNLEFLEKEWKSISNFPKIFILPVSKKILIFPFGSNHV